MIMKMEWLKLVIYVFFAYGITNIIVFGSGPFNIITYIRNLFMKIPTFDEMLQCMMCTSANIGWVLSIIDTFILKDIAITPFNIIINNDNLWYYSLFGDLFFTSGIVWLIHTLQEYYETKTNNINVK